MAIIGDLEIRLRADIARLQRDMDGARGTVNRATASITRAANAAKMALAGMGMGIGLAQVVALSDQYTKFTAQLKLATTSQREYATAMADVKRIATNAQQELGATGMLYARIANGTRELGIAQSQVAKITEVINLALKVSGATANESASAQLQLSQAFASGTLRGEEFNAVNEAAPRLMKALAEGMGVPVGALKQMATDGLITSKIMAEVLPKSFEKLNEESKQIQTIGGALTVLKNSMMELVGSQAQASGFVTNISGALIYAAENVGKLAGAITALTAAIVPAMKIAAAYFAIFVAAPIVIATVTTAMTALIGSLAVFVMNVMIGQTQTLYFNRTLFGMSVSAELAAGSLTKLMLAGSILFAAFAGWQIGSYLSEQFAEARIAGLVFVGLMVKGWENLKYGGEMAWEGVKFAFEKSINVMKSGFGSFLVGVARGLNLIGASDTSKQINAYADSLRAASGAQKTFTAQTAGLTAAHDKAIDVIDTNIVEMIAYELSAKNVAKADGEATKAAAAAVVVAKEKAKAVKAVVDAIEQQLAALRLQVATLGMAEDAATLYKMKMDGATKAQLDQAKSLLLLIGADKFYADQVKSKYDASSASIKAATDEADKNEELARTFGMTKAAIELEELARLEQQLTQAGGIAACTAETAALEALIDAKKRNAAATGSIEAMEAEKKFNADRLTEQAKTVEKYDDIFRTGFADMVNGGKNTWKSFTTSLATTFKTSVADQIYKMFAQPFVVKFVASMMGIVGSGVASSAAAGGSSMIESAAGSAIGNYATSAITLGGSTIAAIGSSVATGVSAGMAGTSVAGAASAYGAAGMTGVSAGLTTGSAVGAALAAIPVWGWAALAVLTVAKVFGGRGDKKVTSQGIEGNFGNDGFSGNNFANWKQDGGWFHRDRDGKKTSALDDATAKQFSESYASIKSTASSMAAALGLSADSIADYSEQISVTLTKDEAKNQEAIAKMFSDLGDNITTRLAPGIASYSKENETASATLQRLSVSLSAVNGIFDTLNLKLYDTSLAGGAMASSLVDLFGGLQNMQSVSAGYFQSYYSEQEKVDIATRQLGKTFSDLGFVMPVTNAELRKQIEAQDLTTEAGRKSYAQLMGLSGAFASLTGATDQLAQSAAASAAAVAEAAQAAAQAAADAARAAAQAASDASAQAYDDAKSATNAALQAVQRAINAEKSRIGVIRDVAAESVRSITTVFDLLKDQIGQLYGTVGGTSAMQASQGSAFIDNALQNVLSTGYLPDQKELQAAISAARGGLDSSQFATQIEADRAALVMAGKLSQLQVASSYQLTTAERSLQAANEQLDALDAQLVYAQQQVDALNGINISVLSVTAAIAGLAAAMAAQKSAAVPSGGTVPMPTNPSTIYEGMGSDITTIQDLYTVNLGRVGEASGIDYWTNQFMADGVISTEEKQAFALAAMPEYKAKYGFEVGTNYVPYDMVAQIHEGEAIVPRAYNPAAGGGNNAELLEELRAQRAENREMSQRLDAALYAIAKSNMNIADTIDTWDGAGMPDVRVDA